MNWQKIKHYTRIVGSIIGIGIFVYLVVNAINELAAIDEPIIFRGEYLVFALSITFFIYLMQMINYQMMVSIQSINAKLKDILAGYAYSFLYKYIPGYIWGYVSRSDWYERETSIPPASSWIASAGEVVITVATSLSIWLCYYLGKRGVDAILTFGVILIPFVMTIPLNLIISRLRKLKKTERFTSGFDSIPFGEWSIITINSYIQWGLFGIGLWAMKQAFSLEFALTIENLANYVYSFARAWVSGFLMVFIPNGLGVREVVLKELLVEVGEIGSTPAVLISTSYRLVIMAAELGWVVLMVLVNRRQMEKK